MHCPPELITIASALDGWEVEPEDGSEALPIVTWALVADPQSAPFVCGMVLGEDGQTVELAPVGTYRRST